MTIIHPKPLFLLESAGNGLGQEPEGSIPVSSMPCQYSDVEPTPFLNDPVPLGIDKVVQLCL